MFDTVLVANRGEIAVRITRTLHRLGVRSVAVHTEADRGAPHVRAADEAVSVGDYLDAGELVRAALRSGAQAVHPGYGFLSENAEFAVAVQRAGLVFVGPPAEAIALMGDKIRAKQAVADRGVPVVPGSHGTDLTDDQLVAAARQVGLPVLLKPSAGGGGKGMRLVRDPVALPQEILSARRAAVGAFGDGTLLLERWVEQPRHIEVQVLADVRGTVVHLGERECSLQRRHQKIIEETPSVLLDPPLRRRMGEAAVEVARCCGYTGVGTVEFIVSADRPDEFFFLEMNTRLQVEHPVTECVTGLDLVEWQLRVAAGEALPFTQQQVTFSGHAVEARLYGEDPARGFLPTGGPVLVLREPSGEGVRVDSGLAEGWSVGSAYDPMLAKIVAHGPDRPTALRRLRVALEATRVLGLTTNLGFLRRLLSDPDVAAGRLDTDLVERRLDTLVEAAPPARVLVAAALVAQRTLLPPPEPGGWSDPFAQPSGWRLGERGWTVHRLRVGDGDPERLRIRPEGPAPGPWFEVAVGDGPAARAALREVPGVPERVLVEYDGVSTTFDQVRAPDGGWWLACGADTWRVRPFDPVVEAQAGSAADSGTLTAPMPGTVTLVKAAPGDRVTAGQTVLVVEAMKMEHAVTAPFDGVLEQLRVQAGAPVAMDEVLAVVASPEALRDTDAAARVQTDVEAETAAAAGLDSPPPSDGGSTVGAPVAPERRVLPKELT